MPWEITLFGPPVLRDPTGVLPAVTRFRTQKEACLLAYLALHGMGRPCSREIVTEALWPEAEPTAARNRFKQELATLRRQIEPAPLNTGDVLEATGRAHVSLRADMVTTDVARFEQLVRQADLATGNASRCFALLQEATTLHGAAGLLPEFYEDWLSGERERLRVLYRSGLRRLIALHVGQGVGTYSEALSAAHTLTAADPTDESGRDALIRLLLSHGDVSHARQQLEAGKNTVPTPLDASVTSVLEQMVAEAERSLALGSTPPVSPVSSPHAEPPSPPRWATACLRAVGTHPFFRAGRHDA